MTTGYKSINKAWIKWKRPSRELVYKLKKYPPRLTRRLYKEFTWRSRITGISTSLCSLLLRPGSGFYSIVDGNLVESWDSGLGLLMALENEENGYIKYNMTKKLLG